jgi:hypothetical protein
MTTPLLNNSSNNLPQEDHLQEDILPQEDQRPKTHFQLDTIRQANKPQFTTNHQERYSAEVTLNPFQLLDIHNQLATLEGQLSQMTDMVATIVNQLHNMTH